ncbi:unannotated protein [freshwater metagenome]|uniref:Unannotated protein n=1 Tax=freshwater metagenome TaxID=449393 RepID=A0A6J6MRK0_9ZZZZ
MSIAIGFQHRAADFHLALVEFFEVNGPDLTGECLGIAKDFYDVAISSDGPKAMIRRILYIPVHG